MLGDGSARSIDRSTCKAVLVSFDDWMLALHVLSAFAWVAGLVVFWVLIVAVRKADTADETIRMEPIGRIGNVAVGVGMGGTILFGLWLAFSVGGYDIWDGWIVAAYMQGATRARELEAAGQTGPSAELLELNRTSSGVFLHLAWSVVVVLILVDMIWKPGA